MSEDFRTPGWWDNRVKELRDKPKDLIFLDHRREELWKRVDELLLLWKDLSVLDVCCGYGRFAGPFSCYKGIDFSKEMVSLAKEMNPGKDIVVADAKMGADEMYDVIFEVNSLHSLGMTPQEFANLFGPKARVAVACLERAHFTIFNVYNGKWEA